ncbi:MAG: YbaN family protein [Dehalococcoidales bacterium]|nr:YbaN family protein [Dehalococcoidales bacterium]
MFTPSATLKSRLFIAAGSISIGVGIIGIFLPLLPTTPFLLLAAYCYGRGSKRLYNRLLRNRLVGDYLRNYLEGKAMSIKAKIYSLSLLWTVIGLTAAFVVDSQVVKIVLLAVGAGVTVHVALLRLVTSRLVLAQKSMPHGK